MNQIMITEALLNVWNEMFEVSSSLVHACLQMLVKILNSPLSLASEEGHSWWIVIWSSVMIDGFFCSF